MCRWCIGILEGGVMFGWKICGAIEAGEDGGRASELADS